MDETKLQKNCNHSSLIFFSIILGMGLIFYFLILRPQQRYYNERHLNIHGVYLLKPLSIKDFSLKDINGKEFSNRDLKQKWTMIYFGFTPCEIICPSVMSALNTTYANLAKTFPTNKLPQIVFVSIDPDRESLHELHSYVQKFNVNFNEVSGSAEAITRFEQNLHVLATKQQINNKTDDYTLNHTTDVLLVNPDGRIQAYFTYPQRADYLAKDYRKIIVKYNK